MKTRVIIALILFNVSLLFAQINPKWKFVGPKTCCSPTTTNDLFRSGQIDDITVHPDPSFTDHIIVRSTFIVSRPFAGTMKHRSYNHSKTRKSPTLNSLCKSSS
jgi:hypothetical protein